MKIHSLLAIAGLSLAACNNPAKNDAAGEQLRALGFTV